MLENPAWPHLDERVEKGETLFGATFTPRQRRIMARCAAIRRGRRGSRPTPRWMPLLALVETGLFLSGTFNADHELPSTWDAWGPFQPEPGEDFRSFYRRASEIPRYGVCDSVEQFKTTDLYAKLASETRIFAVSFVEIRKSEQPSHGGWRWHKWGEYIGRHDPQCEYLYDEEGIESVFCFHVYEKMS